jgi:nucleoside-diphosphate-sugar epimerase
LTTYILGTLKLTNRGGPFQNSIIDSATAFYSAIRSSKPLDERISGSRGRDIIKHCLQTIQAANIRFVARVVQPATVISAIRPTVLVLGGSGFIGRELVQQLLSSGYSVRAMIRGSSAILDELMCDRLEIARGDIRSESDLRSAMAGIEYVYHLAHTPGKTWQEYQENDIEPTRLIAEICLDTKVKRLIYTGTIASYHAGAHAGTITEKTSLDPNIARRDYYSRAKAVCEDLLLEMHRTRQLPLVIFRPGIVIGKGGNPFHWGVGRFSQNVCEVWGEGKNNLPLVLVTDVAAALVQGIKVPEINGRSFNLIDLPLISARDYLNELQRRAGFRLSIIYRPIWYFYMSDVLKWVVKMTVRHPDRIRIPSYSDWDTRTQKAVFNCSAARTELGWQPASDRQRIFNEGVGASVDSWREAID